MHCESPNTFSHQATSAVLNDEKLMCSIQARMIPLRRCYNSVGSDQIIRGKVKRESPGAKRCVCACVHVMCLYGCSCATTACKTYNQSNTSIPELTHESAALVLCLRTVRLVALTDVPIKITSVVQG